MKNILEKLFEGHPLTEHEAYDVLLNMGANTYNEAQMSSFLTVYKLRSVTSTELSGFRKAMLEMATKVEFDTESRIDIVGTGGDGKNSFNISTLSCFLVAGAGYKVTKHGNYGVSSVSGSSNILAALGVEFTHDINTLKRQLDESNFCFMHAQLFHPAMKYIAPVRKELKFRTIFNYLGPISNPSDPTCFLLGTNGLDIAKIYRSVLESNNKKFRIVNSLDGFDEVSLTSPVVIFSPEKEELLEPRDFGFSLIQESEIGGGNSVEESKSIFLSILKNEGTAAQENVVIANAGLAIQILNPNLSLDDAIHEARESLKSGMALDALQKFIHV